MIVRYVSDTMGWNGWCSGHGKGGRNSLGSALRQIAVVDPDPRGQHLLA